MKKTKVEMLKEIAALEAIATNPELSDFVNGEIIMLESRKANKKPTKTQAENENIKTDILNVLTESAKPMRVKDLREDDRLVEFTSQKLTALLNQLVHAHTVKRIVDKKVTTFEIMPVTE